MSFYNVYDNPNPFSVKDGLTARNLDALNVGNLSALNIGGLGAMFNIETAQSTIVQNTKTSSSSVLGYVFAQGGGAPTLTTVAPTSAQVIAATNVAGDAYQQLINDLRACDSFRQLDNVYKNVVITLGITLVRVMLELNQVAGGSDYIKAGTALSVISQFNQNPSAGPLAPIQNVIIPAINTLMTAIENRDKATATTLAAALPGIITTQFGIIIASLAVALGAGAADQITFMGTLATLASALTASTLAAFVSLAGQTFPSMF